MNAELTTEIVGKVESALNALAAKIGVGVDHFWPLFVKQQMIEGYTKGAGLLLALMIFVICAVVAIKYRNHIANLDNPGTEVSIKGIVGVICGIIGAIALITVFIVGVGNGETIISHICNPEYNALQDIIHLVK